MPAQNNSSRLGELAKGSERQHGSHESRGAAVTASYRFRVSGTLSDDLLRSFGPSSWQHDDRWHGDEVSTVFVIEIHDQTELFGVLGRCEMLRLTLLELEVLAPTELS
jgi:hypothetical protein